MPDNLDFVPPVEEDALKLVSADAYYFAREFTERLNAGIDRASRWRA
jgi:hypothetical protein